MDPLAFLAPLGDAAVLLDDHWNGAQFDLLQSSGRLIEIFQPAVATRTMIEAVFPGFVEFVVGKWRAFMPRVSRLAARLSLATFSLCAFASCRLDDVRRRRLRGGGGVLKRLSKCGFKFGQTCLKLRDAGA